MTRRSRSASRRATARKARFRVLDITVDEARAISLLQARINRRYVFADKDLATWSRLCDELREGMAEIGFEVEVRPVMDGVNIRPECDIIRRLDTHRQQVAEKEGPDFERLSYESKRASSSDLAEEGVDVSLLMR